MREVLSPATPTQRLDYAMAERLGVPAMPKERWSPRTRAMAFAAGCALVGALSASARLSGAYPRVLCVAALVIVRSLAVIGALERRWIAIAAVPMAIGCDAFVFACVYGGITHLEVFASLQVALLASVVFAEAVRSAPPRDETVARWHAAVLLAVSTGIALRPYAQRSFDPRAAPSQFSVSADAYSLVVAALLVTWATVATIRRRCALRRVEQWRARILAGDETTIEIRRADAASDEDPEEVASVALPDGRGTLWFTPARARHDGDYRSERLVRQVAIMRDPHEETNRLSGAIVTGVAAMALGGACAFSYVFHRATLCSAYALGLDERMIACIETDRETIAIIHTDAQPSVAGRVLSDEGSSVQEYVASVELFPRLGMRATAPDEELVAAARSTGLVAATYRPGADGQRDVHVDHAPDGEPLLVIDIANSQWFEPGVRVTFGLRTGSYAFTNF